MDALGELLVCRLIMSDRCGGGKENTGTTRPRRESHRRGERRQFTTWSPSPVGWSRCREPPCGWYIPTFYLSDNMSNLESELFLCPLVYKLTIESLFQLKVHSFNVHAVCRKALIIVYGEAAATAVEKGEQG